MRIEGKRRSLFLTLCALLFCFLCQSCAVLKVRNALPTEAPKGTPNICDIKYSISISSNVYTNTFGKRSEKNDIVEKTKDAYIESTRRVLDRKGCKATYVTSGQEANMNIIVDRHFQRSAYPQEWLCGLSLGIIPSRATRECEIRHTFDKKELSTPYTYCIDTVDYCHILLLPFGFKPRYADELKMYEESFANYLNAGAQSVAAASNPSQELSDAERMMEHNQPETARKFIADALHTFQKSGDTLGEAEAYHSYGNFYKKGNMGVLDYEKSEESFRKASELYAKKNNFMGMMKSSFGIGNTFHARNDYPKACEAYARSMDYYLKAMEVTPDERVRIQAKYANPGEMIDDFMKSISCYQLQIQ